MLRDAVEPNQKPFLDTEDIGDALFIWWKGVQTMLANTRFIKQFWSGEDMY